MEKTTPAPRDIWREILRQDPYALISQTPEWIDCICKSGPYEDASQLIELSPHRQAVLPAVRNKWLPEALNSVSSLPHGWGIGGPILPGGVTPEDITLLFSNLSKRSTLQTSIRPNPLIASQWKIAAPETLRSEQHITQIVSLDGGFDGVWKHRFSSATRNKIRKAEKSGLTVEVDHTGRLLPEYYNLYMKWTERRARERHLPVKLSRLLASIREPYSKFEAVVNILGESCQLWVARLGDQVAAASFKLTFGEHAIFWRSASDKELTLKTRANDLLQKLMIEDACHAGCRYYNMGESGGVASLMYFKSRFGAVEYPYEEFFLGELQLDDIKRRARGFISLTEHWLLSQKKEAAHERRADD